MIISALRHILRSNFQNRWLIVSIILGVAIAIRLACFLSIPPSDGDAYFKKVLNHGDAPGYNMPAVSMLEDGKFTGSRTIGYPLFVAFIYSIFGINAWMILVVQIIIDLCTLTAVFFLAKELSENIEISLISSFLYAVNISMAFYTRMLYTETLFVFFFIFSMLIFIRALKTRHLSLFLISAIGMGYSTLIRPIHKYFPFVMVATILLSQGRKQDKLIQSIAVAAIYLMILTPWQVHNLMKHGYYMISDIQWFNIYMYNVATVKAKVEGINFGDAYKKLGDKVEAEIERSGKTSNVELIRIKLYKELALNYILQNPWQYLKYHIQGIGMLFMNNIESHSINECIDWNRPTIKSYTPVSLALMTKTMLEHFFALIGVIMFVVYRRFDVSFIFCGLTILYFSNIVGVIGWIPRLKVPMIPIILIFSAIGLFETWRFLRERRFSPL